MKTIVFFGATGRLGSFVLENFENKNCNLINISSKKNANFQSDIFQFEAELSNYDELFQILKVLNSDIGQIDVLINFAGRSARKKSDEISTRLILENINNELSILLNVAEIFFKERQIFASPFKIIDIGSIWADRIPKSSVYLDLGNEPDLSVMLTKTSKRHLIRYLARFSKDYNIIANQITPGWFPRPSINPRIDYINGIESTIPVGRIGQPRDLLGAINFLVNENSNYINGSELVVDGGFHIY